MKTLLKAALQWLLQLLIVFARVIFIMKQNLYLKINKSRLKMSKHISYCIWRSIQIFINFWCQNTYPLKASHQWNKKLAELLISFPKPICTAGSGHQAEEELHSISQATGFGTWSSWKAKKEWSHYSDKTNRFRWKQSTAAPASPPIDRFFCSTLF